MSIAPPRLESEKHCLVYCGDQFCTCRRGPQGRRLPPSVVRSMPYIGPPDDNFHHGWDYVDNLPEDGSPRELYVLMHTSEESLHRVFPSIRSLVHASIIDDGLGRLVGDRVTVQHKLRVRRRWLPIAQMARGLVAVVGCETHPSVRISARTETQAGEVLLVHGPVPLGWRATHFDRTTMRRCTVRSQIAPHGSERRVPRLPTPRPVRSPED